MDQGTITLKDLRDLLCASQRRAYVRAILLRAGAQWQLKHVLAVVGREPPSWAKEVWQFEQMMLVAVDIDGVELSNVCDLSENATLALGTIEAVVPPRFEQGSWQRRPSYAQYDTPPLPWPSRDFSFSSTAQLGLQMPPGFQVGENCPSFPDSSTAYRAFVQGDFSLSGAQMPPTDLARIRLVEDAGWLGAVHVEPSRMSIEVLGEAVGGATLELYGESHRASQPIEQSGTVELTLAEGPPAQAWLWLKKSTEWMDYRPLLWPWAAPEQLANAGVEFDLPAEPEAAIEALISAGEGPQLEFKRILPTTADERRKAFKTVAAFANGLGGTVVFGVDPDEATIVGLGDGEAASLRDRLGHMVRARVIPTPEFRVEHHRINEKFLLVLHVEAGASPPYGITVDDGSREKPEFYVRRGASTYHAQPSDLREATVPSPAAPPQPPWMMR
jgi:hypothetical protein